MQMDMFDPPHIAFRKEAEAYRELAAPYLKRASDAERMARELCPHEVIEHELIIKEDDYGSYVPEWTEIKVWCAFCGKTEYVNKAHAVDAKLTYMDILLGKGRDL